MTKDYRPVKQKSFFKKIPKNCDSFMAAGKFPNELFVVTGPCQIVLRKQKGNWFYIEFLKDKNTKIIKAPRKSNETPRPEDE